MQPMQTMDLCIGGLILYLPGILFSALRDAPTILIEFVVSTCICNICIFVFARRILNWQCNISEPLVPRNIRFSVVLLLAIKPTILATTCQQSLLTRVKGGDDIKMHKSCHPCNYKHFCLNKNTWNKKVITSQLIIFQNIFSSMQPAWLSSLLVGSVQSDSGEKICF